jgi:hypothetical protein
MLFSNPYEKIVVGTTIANTCSRMEVLSEAAREPEQFTNVKQMRLVGIGTVKNEADIIECFVRHNLRVLDMLVLIDDGSVDGTKEILLSLEAEGLNLIMLEWDGSGYEQSRKLSELSLVLTSRGDFDWLFALDADEAIDCGSRAALEKELEKVPRKQVGSLPWHTYVPTSADDWSQQNPYLRIINRRERETPQYYKVVVPVKQFKWSPVVIAKGSHKAQRAVTFKPLLAEAMEDVALAHFPVRTPKQLLQKIICGWLSVLAEGRRSPGQSFHWHGLYAQLMERGEPTLDELEQVALSYASQKHNENTVRSPLRVTYQSSLRYNKKEESPLFITLARTVEEIIRKRKGLMAGNCRVGISRYRTAWRHRAALVNGIRPDQEGAVTDYLCRRFGVNVPFINGEDPRLPQEALDGNRGFSTNRVNAIVLVRRKKRRTKTPLKPWSDNGWVVDHTATLAVRLLTRSARIRRNCVVLVACVKGGIGQAPSDHVPKPSSPAWWEHFRRIVLWCHLFAVKYYWFFRSAFGKYFVASTGN